MEVKEITNKILHNDKTGGILLIITTLVSLILANTLWGGDYISFWQTKVIGLSLEHWINDGLMAIFFLLIGLELEREIYIGELSSKKKAILPFFAALGGMLVPAGIFLIFNNGTDFQSGAGIPMATDIAFALGILSLFGKRVPLSLKVFLTALAVIDDLGAILVIAIFYTQNLSLLYLGLALLMLIILIVLNRLKVHALLPYLIGGVAMWIFMLNSGVHATITGVILAFAIPFRSINKKSPSHYLLDILHSPVTFIILPIFALANTAIEISSNQSELITSTLGIGIIGGLLIGKPLGIALFCYLSTFLGFTKLPSDINWKQIISVGFLGGIGFTMSIFIALLAFSDSLIINNTKLLTLMASLSAGVIGYLLLNYTLKKSSK